MWRAILRPLTWTVNCLIYLDLTESELRAAALKGKLPEAVITQTYMAISPALTGWSALAEEYGFAWISDSAEAMGSTRKWTTPARERTAPLFFQREQDQNHIRRRCISQG